MSKATMIDEQKLRELAEAANLSIKQRADMTALEFEDAEAKRFAFRESAPTAILALIDELQSLRSERTAWRVTAENAEAAAKQARVDALEEARAICIRQAGLSVPSYDTAIQCADAIESLKGKTP